MPQWAGDLASDIGVAIVLAHVVEPVVVPARWLPVVADFESERVASGQRMLARLSASFRDTPSDCVVSVGRPADTIASLAVEYEADLVVMGLANTDDSELRISRRIGWPGTSQRIPVSGQWLAGAGQCRFGTTWQPRLEEWR